MREVFRIVLERNRICGRYVNRSTGAEHHLNFICYRYRYQLKHPFSIARANRTVAPRSFPLIYKRNRKKSGISIMVKDFRGAAGKPNQLPRTNASSKMGKGRRKDKDPGSQRSAETIARLKMYNNGKAIRNKKGDVVAGSFMMGDRAGDRRITAETGRIQPDRRWFGNTRTVAATDLDKFRQEMTEAVSDPYSVVLKRKKLPMGLLQEAAEYSA